MFAMLTALALAVPGGDPPEITYFYAYVTPENVLYVDGTVEDDMIVPLVWAEPDQT